MEISKLRVAIKGQTEAIIEGNFSKKIKVDDSLWTLEKDGAKRSLQLTMAKKDKMQWWDCILEGDALIDT
jgi:hypothetical protein